MFARLCKLHLYHAWRIMVLFFLHNHPVIIILVTKKRLLHTNWTQSNGKQKSHHLSILFLKIAIHLYHLSHGVKNRGSHKITRRVFLSRVFETLNKQSILASDNRWTWTGSKKLINDQKIWYLVLFANQQIIQYRLSLIIFVCYIQFWKKN